jgi:hypothetical protein
MQHALSVQAHTKTNVRNAITEQLLVLMATVESQPVTKTALSVLAQRNSIAQDVTQEQSSPKKMGRTFVSAGQITMSI